MDSADSLSEEKARRGCWATGLFEEAEGQSWYLEAECAEKKEGFFSRVGVERRWWSGWSAWRFLRDFDRRGRW